MAHGRVVGEFGNDVIELIGEVENLTYYCVCTLGMRWEERGRGNLVGWSARESRRVFAPADIFRRNHGNSWNEWRVSLLAIGEGVLNCYNTLLRD